MAHKEQQDFFNNVKKLFPKYFKKVNVLDCGSLDINGSNRHLFKHCKYIGIDLNEGKNVDVVSKIHDYVGPDESFDTIISGEAFEHDCYYVESLKNIVRMLKKGGLFVFTCAGPLRPEHGTPTHDPDCSPFTVAIDDWKDYYKGLSETDIRAAMDIDGIFSKYKFIELSEWPFDLYFWGIKNTQ